MKLLAIETSTNACSVALEYAAGQRLIQHFIELKNHAQLILPAIEKIMNEAGLSFKQLDALTFGRGPGSFTGLRISASVIQAIAWVNDLPVIPISSLLGLAQTAYKHTNKQEALVCVDAKIRAYYFLHAKLNSLGVMKEVVPETYIKAEELLQVLDRWKATSLLNNLASSSQIVAIGDGWINIPFEYNNHMVLAPTHYAEAQSLLDLILSQPEHFQKVSAEEALPVYLAEIQYKKLCNQ